MSKGRPEDQAELARWLTRLAYEWQRDAERCYSEFRFAEASIFIHEAVEFTVKALCKRLDVGMERIHFPTMETLVALSERVGKGRPEDRNVILNVAPILLGYDNVKRNMARYGYEGPNYSAIAPTRTFGKAYCMAGREVLKPITELLTRVQVAQRWSTPPIRVGILDALTGDGAIPCPQRWSGACSASPSYWGTILGPDYDVKSVRIGEIDDGLAAVLSPFGETYPETDLVNRPCYRRVASYIEDGGFYIASAGVPFFAAWDSSKGSDHDLSDSRLLVPTQFEVVGSKALIKEFRNLIMLEGTIASREFGILPTLDDGGHVEPLDVEVMRASSAPTDLPTISDVPGTFPVFRPARRVPDGATPILSCVHPSLGEVYPTLIASKGRGSLLAAGLNLKDAKAATLFEATVKTVLEWNRNRFRY